MTRWATSGLLLGLFVASFSGEARAQGFDPERNRPTVQDTVRILEEGCLGDQLTFVPLRLYVGERVQAAIYSMIRESRKSNVVLRIPSDVRVSFDYSPPADDRSEFKKRATKCLDTAEFEQNVRQSVQRNSSLVEVSRRDLDDILSTLGSAGVFGPGGIDPASANKLKQLDVNAIVQVSPFIEIVNFQRVVSSSATAQDDIRAILGADIKVVNVATSQRKDDIVRGSKDSMRSVIYRLRASRPLFP